MAPGEEVSGRVAKSGRIIHRHGAMRPGGCAHLERLAALRVFVDQRLGGRVGLPCHGAESVPRAARTSGAWLGSGVEGKPTRDGIGIRHENPSRLHREAHFFNFSSRGWKKRDKWPFLIGRDTEGPSSPKKVTPTTSERPSHSSSRRTGNRPRAASPSNTVVLVMSLAVVAPHRAPSIDPALRAFLAECLDGTDVDGDIGEVRSVDVPDLPRALSFDDADVDLSGICAWLEGDVGLATNDDDDDDDDDDDARARARVDHPARVLDIEETRATGFARARLGSRPRARRATSGAGEARRRRRPAATNSPTAAPSSTPSTPIQTPTRALWKQTPKAATLQRRLGCDATARPPR